MCFCVYQSFNNCRTACLPRGVARRFDSEARAYYNRKLRRTNASIAHSALAHKLARAAYYIMRDGIPFKTEKAFA